MRKVVLSRTQVCQLVAVAIGLLFVVSCAPAPTPPNVVLISLDTTRPDHLGAYGYQRPTSPHFDRLASGGLVFDRAVAQMTITNPSHASMFTGLYPHTHKVGENTRKLEERFQTLTEVLKARGYATGGFVSGHPLRKEITGLTQGFDAYDSEMQRRRNGEVTAKRALDWLTSLRADEESTAEAKPFFMFVHFYDAHGPFRYRPDFDHLFQSEEPGPRLEFIPKYQKIMNIKGEKLFFRNQYLDRYDAGLRYQDEQLGKLLDALDLENTLVIVTADHGETLFERAVQLNLNHGTAVFQEQIAIPLVFAGWGIEAGRDSRLAETVDLVPTILEHLGMDVEFPYPLEGESLFGAEVPASKLAFASNKARTSNHADRGYELDNNSFIHSVQNRDWKLIRYPAVDGLLFELYDLATDPTEQVNLAQEKANILAGMSNVLAGWASELDMGDAPDLPPEELEQLRALGYIN